MIDLEKAVYKSLSIPEFIGNPLIEALPDDVPPEDYPAKLFVCPPYSDQSRALPADVRLQELQRISQLHVPTRADSMMMLSVRRCLNWGYVSRNPLPFEVVKAALTEHEIEVTPALERYFRHLKAPIYGFPILGVSGIGKTTSVDNLMNLYPQVLEHSQYRGIPFNTRQLVWLKVECPGDGTPKGLCHSIVHGIDIAMETNYAGQIIKNRMSKDVLSIKVSQLLRSLHLGILLIDDIQNLMSASTSVSSELLSFMVALTNLLKIPVVMIGTPKITRLLQKEFQMAKRASGEGEIRMLPMADNSREWEVFLNVLWKFQYTAKEVSLTKSMRKAFYEESVGIPFLAAILYKVAQDEAIINRTESFAEADIHQIATEKLGLTAQKRRDMLNGEDVEFNEIMNLWTAASMPQMPQMAADAEQLTITPKDLQASLRQQIIKTTGMAVKEANLYSRRAIAAMPDITDVDKLLGYVMQIKKAAEAKSKLN